MAKDSIRYVVDERGRRIGVIISYKAYRDLMQQIADLNAEIEAASVARNPRQDWDGAFHGGGKSDSLPDLFAEGEEW